MGGTADLLSYIIRKVLLAIPVIILATLIVFLMLYMTGDPINALAPPHASVEEMDALREVILIPWSILDLRRLGRTHWQYTLLSEEHHA